MRRLNELNQLSVKEKALYLWGGLILGGALILGFLFGLLHWVAVPDDRSVNWVGSEFIESHDTLADFNLITEKPHWFMDQAAVAAQAKVEEQKSVEGSPEAFKLTGIVDRKGRKIALFLPQLTKSSISGVRSVSIGDTLIGDWKVESITASEVTLSAAQVGADPQIRQIKLYDLKKR